MLDSKCSTCARCKNQYCLFFNRPVDTKLNTCKNHTDLNKADPVTAQYLSPSQAELNREMEVNNKIDAEYPFKMLTGGVY